MKLNKVTCLMVVCIGVFCSLAYSSDQKKVAVRNGLPNLYSKLEAGEDVTIAYFGGSITAQNGYRMQTFKWFEENWPQCEFTQVNAAIGGTGSELGAFRLYDDVLSNDPDLVFIEFAVNDYGASQNSQKNVEESMEGIIRQIINNNPQTDMCLVYTITESMIEDMKAGKMLPSIAAHEKVADHYGLPSVNVGSVVADLENEGKLVMKGQQGLMQAVSGDSLNETVEVGVNEKGQVVFSKDGVHPYPNSGHKIYTQCIVEAIALLRGDAENKEHEQLPCLNENNLEKAKMVSLSMANLKGDWKKYNPEGGVVSSWIADKMPEMMVAKSIGDSIEFRLNGFVAGFYDVMGPSAGVVECQVDDEKKYLSRFDKYCTYYRIGSKTIEVEKGIHDVKFTLTDRPIEKAAVLSERGSVMKDRSKYEDTHWYVGKIMLVGDIIK
ncbi:MAG: SGNH/GDSL hydrolase family protein [Sedimentisphaeraceae bacterium JB056]